MNNCVLSFIDYYYTCSSSVIQFKISVRLKSTKAKKHLAFYFSAIRSLQYCSTVDIIREKSSFNPLFHLFFPILWFQNRTVGFITNQQSHSCIFNIYYFENIASFFERRYTQYWFMLIPSLCECSAKDLCRLLGILNLNCPEYSCRLFGSGISIPSSNAASIHAFLASATFAMALSRFRFS